MQVKIRHKKCKVCKETFQPFRPLQVCCSSGCAIQHAQEQRIKKDRKEYREAKTKSKTRKEWLKDAERACNAYIRVRDGKVCISCGTTNPNVQYAAGHYRTVKAASQLRYNEDNIHVQCNYRCNKMLSGNLSNYRPVLIAKIGIERVEALENNNEGHTYTIEELKEIKANYTKKLRELKQKELY